MELHDMLTGLIEHCDDFLAKTFLSWSLAKATCAGALTFLFAFLNGATREFLVVFMLIFIDFLMALFVLTKTNGRFKSAGVWRLAEKWAITFLLLGGVELAESIIYVPFASEITAAAMASSQLISILEHVSVMGMVVPIPLLKTLRKIRDGEK